MRKPTFLIATAFMALLAFSSQAFAASAESDPYKEGFEAYAKENQMMEDAIKSYLKDLEKAIKEKPDLVETKEELGHAGE